MWKHVAAHALRKTAPLRLKLYIARDKRTMIRLQSSLFFIYTATHLYVPAYSPLVFFVFCLVLFLTSFEEKKSAKRRFFLSLSLFWLSFLSALLFLPGSKKKQKSLSSLYPSFTTNARRNKERETNAREQSSANASPRWKSAAERAERNARRRRFSTLFLVFSFEREKKERRGEALRRKKKRKFFGKRGKGKNKLKREFSTKKRTTEEKKKKREGGSIDRAIEKKKN